MATIAAAVASLDDIRTLSHEITDEFLACRTRGHRWEELGKVDYSRKHRTYEETVDCERCEAQRVTLYSHDGEILRVRSTYPDGYLLTGLGRIDRDGRKLLRRERFERRRRPVRAVSNAS